MARNEDEAIVKEQVEIPSVSRLARIYRDALASGDQSTASVAEATAMKVANAEGTLSEAVSITRFINEVAS